MLVAGYADDDETLSSLSRARSIVSSGLIWPNRHICRRVLFGVRLARLLIGSGLDRK